MTQVFDAATSIFGNTQQAYAQEKIADETAKRQMQMNRENIAENARQFNENMAARKSAYEAARATGGEQMGGGEGAFMTAADTVSPELAQLKSDIQAGNAEAINAAGREMGANIAAQGVRGGQAATQLRRGIGSMGIQAQRDINSLVGNEAMQRAAEKRAYLAAKAGRGQAATLQGAY